MRIEAAPASPLAGIYLRQMEGRDIESWFAYLRLPQVYQHTSWNVSTPADLMPMIQTYESTLATSARRLAIIDASNQALIGSIGFHTISDVNLSAEIAYDLAPSAWGRGIASALCDTVTRWAFAEYSFVRIQATVLESNVRSMQVLENCGYQYEGLLRAFRQVRGMPGNFKMYARLAGDQLPVKKAV